MSAGLILNTLSFVYTTIFHRNKVTWKGLYPSRAVQVRMKKKTKKCMNRAIILNYFDLKEFGEAKVASFHYNETKKQLFFGNKDNQRVKTNSSADLELLSKSLLNIFPHEVMEIRIHTSSGELFCSKVKHGNMFSVGKLRSIKSEVYKVLEMARRSGEQAIRVEVAHTHPSYDTVFTDGNSSSYLINGLSESDKNVGITLREFIDVPVEIKAISASGVNYSKEF